MSKCKRRQRPLGVECLGQRNVLSAIPVLPSFAMAAGEGENATVDHQGQIVTIIGSDNDDTIELELSETVHQLTVNGETTQFNASEANEFIIRGDAGNDTVMLTGTSQNESAEVADGILELVSDSYRVEVSLVEQVTVDGQGGFDRAVLFDTDGDDMLELRSDSAQLVDKDNLQFSVQGFDRVMSFATNGGNDQANFHGTSADDTFIGKADFSFMIGTDFWNYTRGYERVDVFQDSMGNDTAWLVGSSGNDDVNATAEEVTLTLANGNILATHNFGTTQVDAGAGDDTATLNGTNGAADRLVWTPESASLRTIRGGDIITTTVKGMERVNAFGGESGDSAELFGSNEADELIALPEVARLTTPDAMVMAHDFGFVVSHGGEGSDTAFLEDSRFNDNYVGQPRFAYLTGPGYLNLVAQFEEIDVAATNGGYDISTTHFGAGLYTIAGGQPSLPHITNEDNEQVQVGQFELTTAPGFAISAFTQEDLDQNRVVYVHSEDNDDPFDVDITFRFNDALGLETTGDVSFPINKDGAGKRFELRLEDITGGVAEITTPVETNFFGLDVDQHWIYGTSRNERVFGFSRFRSTGPGNFDRTSIDDVPYFFGTRVNQNGLISFPVDWNSEVDARDATPVANYDLIEGELVNVGDATLNPPQIDF